MTPEEFKRIKEAEKDHLRKLNKLKQAARHLERQKKVSRAVGDMTSSIRETLDRHSELMDQVSMEAALNEARLEIALENADLGGSKAPLESDEEVLKKERAKELIREMKSGSVSSGDSRKARSPKSDPSPASGTTPSPAIDDAQSKSGSEKSDDLPEKTIGKMKP
jgi:hypothetical protein